MPPSMSRSALFGLTVRRRRTTTTTHLPPRPSQTRRESTSNQPDALRILFCGSDNFSCDALTALHDLHKADPALVESIDVLVRPGKPSGRGLRRVAVGSLFHLAESLGLPVHQRDTFTGWELPLPGRVTHHRTGERTVFPHPSGRWRHRPYTTFNLIVAVSFGLFVPPRILNTLAYGGLNIHPSLLPDLRGPAPLQWTLLAGRTHTGVTLQTLHHEHFDCGKILAQTALPGIPVPEAATSRDLLGLLAREGAAMLVDGLKSRLHVPPLRSVGWVPSADDTAAGLVREAPKIHKRDSQVDWGCQSWGQDRSLYPSGRWTASDLARRFRALGVLTEGNREGKAPGLWTYATSRLNPKDVRVILEDVEAVPCPDQLRHVVADIARPKTAGISHELPSEYIEGLVNIVWSSMILGETKAFRLPALLVKEEDKSVSVVIPIGVPYKIAGDEASAVVSGSMPPDAIKIRNVRREGMPSKPASTALEPFMEKDLARRDLAVLDYALDIMGSRIEA